MTRVIPTLVPGVVLAFLLPGLSGFTAMTHNAGLGPGRDAPIIIIDTMRGKTTTWPDQQIPHPHVASPPAHTNNIDLVLFSWHY